MGRPQLRYFLTCDAVQVHQGKVTAIGLFDTVMSAIFPAIHGSMAVVLGFEAGTEGKYALSLNLTAPNGDRLAEVQGPEIQMPGTPGTVSQVLELRGLQFPVPGDYQVQVLLDGEFLAQQVLHINEPPRPQIKTAEELEAILRMPEVITSANSELQCEKCRAVFRFQVHLDPTKPRDPGFMAPPPGKIFACGTCGNRINCEGIGTNLRRLLGLHRSWLPVPPPGPGSQGSPEEQAAGTDKEGTAGPIPN